MTQELIELADSLNKIQAKYYTPTSKISADTGIHISTLTQLIKYKLNYGISDSKLELLQAWIDDRKWW